MKTQSQYRLAKNYRIGIFCFITLAALLTLANELLPRLYQENLVIQKLEPQFMAFAETPQTNPTFSDPQYPFNPNDYTADDWKKLGLSEKQIQTVFNYKNALQGFKSKEQFKKCYAISEELYTNLEPYIDLPEKSKSAYSPRKFNSFSYQKNSRSTPSFRFRPFDPNQYSLKDWIKCGFSAKQAQTIMNYKNKFLGGKLKKVEELEKCYAISSEVYQQMKPYVRISEVRVSKSDPSIDAEFSKESPKEKPKNELKPFKINDLDKEGWMKLGFSEKQVKTILKYKKYCGGAFHSLEEFKKCYVVSEEKFQELKPFIIFD